MNIQTIFVIQIIADFVFCVVIVFLLARLRKSLGRSENHVVDQELFVKLQDLIIQSKSDSERFLENIDESCRRFNKLAVGLESRETRLAELFADIDRKSEKESLKMPKQALVEGDRNYVLIAEMLRDGFSMEDVSLRTGVPAGEIALVADLEKLRDKES